MKSSTSNSSHHIRKALTLLELLVVLTILIALGGIVVASLPGLLDRTQTATASANVSEIDSAIRRKLLTDQGQLGNRFDSLITGTGGGGIASYIGGAENFEAATLGSDELAALQTLGITELIPASEVSDNVTFDSHTELPVALGAESKVCALSNAYAAETLFRLWNIEPSENKRYFVFGLGQRSTLVGGSDSAVFKESPVHFSQDALSNPKKMYSRYLLIVEIDTANEVMTKARYVGTAIPHFTGLIGINDQLQSHYGNQN